MVGREGRGGGLAQTRDRTSQRQRLLLAQPTWQHSYQIVGGEGRTGWGVGIKTARTGKDERDLGKPRCRSRMDGGPSWRASDASSAHRWVSLDRFLHETCLGLAFSAVVSTPPALSTHLEGRHVGFRLTLFYEGVVQQQGRNHGIVEFGKIIPTETRCRILAAEPATKKSIFSRQVGGKSLFAR